MGPHILVRGRWKGGSPGSGLKKEAGAAWNPTRAQRGPLGWGMVSGGSTAPRTGTGGGSRAHSVTNARLSPRSLNRLTAEDALAVPRQDWRGFLGTLGRERLPAETKWAAGRGAPRTGTFTRVAASETTAPGRPRAALGPARRRFCRAAFWGRQFSYALGLWTPLLAEPVPCLWFSCDRALRESGHSVFQ